MSLLDEARSQEQRTGSSCALQRTKQQNPDLYAEIVEALESDVNCAALARAIDQRNRERKENDPPPILITRDMLERHRRGDCRRCRT